MFFWFLDSEDSDEEGGLGNVNRLIIRPAGHSGKAKKGLLNKKIFWFESCDNGEFFSF